MEKENKNKDTSKVQEFLGKAKKGIKSGMRKGAMVAILTFATVKGMDAQAQTNQPQDKKIYTQEQVQQLRASNAPEDKVFMEFWEAEMQKRYPEGKQKPEQAVLDQAMMTIHEKWTAEVGKTNEFRGSTTVEQDGNTTRTTTVKTGRLSAADYSEQEREDFNMMKSALDFRTRVIGGTTMANQSRVMSFMADLRADDGGDRAGAIDGFLKKNGISVEKKKNGDMKFSMEHKGTTYTHNHQTRDNMRKSLEQHQQAQRR